MNPPAIAASAVAIPFKPAEDTALPSGPQWGLAIVLCVAALGAMLYQLRRRRGAVTWKREGGLLNVVETRALNQQVQLSVVRYGSRQLLLSIGPTGTQCLRDDPADAGSAP